MESESGGIEGLPVVEGLPSGRTDASADVGAIRPTRIGRLTAREKVVGPLLVKHDWHAGVGARDGGGERTMASTTMSCIAGGAKEGRAANDYAKGQLTTFDEAARGRAPTTRSEGRSDGRRSTRLTPSTIRSTIAFPVCCRPFGTSRPTA
uniref:Uncharacterized protein n=1 Tax=Plectus sambesii TaxID=2011161 RepID=A0A914UJQ0_9BILA